MTRDFAPSARVPAAALLADLRTIAASRPDEAALMPPGIFHSAEFLELELDRLFGAEWVCVGRADELRLPGAYLATKVAEVPVLVTRQEDGSFRGFLNACAHRRAQLVPESRGEKSRFACRYHAWTYATDGTLVGAPYMKDCPGFDKGNVRLEPIHLETWEGFIFVSLAQVRPSPIEGRLRPFVEGYIGRYRMDRYKAIIRDEIVYRGNWKNIIENFTESYHVFFAHSGTFALTGKTPGDYVCGPDLDWCSFHMGTQKHDTGLGAAHADDPHLTGEWRRRSIVACVFPGLLIAVTPDLLWHVSVQPDGVGQFRAAWGAAVPQEFLDDVPQAQLADWIASRRRFMDAANEEDRPLIEALYDGTSSLTPPRGHLHPIEKNVWDFARYLARILGETAARTVPAAAE